MLSRYLVGIQDLSEKRRNRKRRVNQCHCCWQPPYISSKLCLLLQNSQIQSIILPVCFPHFLLNMYGKKVLVQSYDDIFPCSTKFSFSLQHGCQVLINQWHPSLRWLCKQAACFNSVRRHCGIWQLSLACINYWSLMLSLCCGAEC